MDKKILNIKYNFKKNYWFNFFWLFKSKILWSGLDVEDISKYNFSDNVKYLNWKVSARKNELFINKFIEDKALNITFFLDTGSSMNFWSTSFKKIDLLLETFHILYESSKDNNIDIFLFDKDIKKINKKNTNVINIIKEVYSSSFKNFSDLWKVFELLLKQNYKKSIIFILTDQINIDKYKLNFKKISNNNKIFFINILDFFEINYYWKTNINIWNYSYYLNNDNNIKSILDKNKTELWKIKINYLSLNNKENMYSVMYKYFQNTL